MSSIPGSAPRDLVAVLGGAAALAATLYVVTRRDDGNPGRVVAHRADGSRIGTWGRWVRLRPAAAHGWRARLASLRGPRVREDLERGDLSDLRLREGREGEAGWVVEGIAAGADPFRLHWEFTTSDDALAAYRLLDERVAEHAPRPGGDAGALSDREFEERWRSVSPGAPAASHS